MTLKTAIAGFWLIDMEGRLLEIYDVAAALLGYSPEEMTRLAVSDIDAEENPDETGRRIQQVRKEGSACFETRHKRKAGNTVDVEVSVSFSPIGTLAGGIAHDFNNILSIIVGNTELAMLDLPDWTPAQDNLKEVREATLRARKLVKQILLFVRQKEHTVSNIRLEAIAKESLKMLRASLYPPLWRFRIKSRRPFPPVLADPSQIQQIIMNLCTNAGQVMEAEGGTLTLTLDIADLETPLHTLMEELPSGRYVRMQVEDTGPGISPENLERIFDPFFTTKGIGEGTGLGPAVNHSQRGFSGLKTTASKGMCGVDGGSGNP